MPPYPAGVAVRSLPGDVPEEFAQAAARLLDVRLRPEVVIEEVPPPRRIAPFAAAVTADVVVQQVEHASGRFVLLHDPAAPPAWGGTFRVVTFVRASLEPELAADPMLGDVGWTWLQESLAHTGAEVTAAGGTVTRIVSESFGSLEDRPRSVELEVRASWTPLDDLAAHVQAWGALLCTVAGLPPLPEGVAPLRARRD